MISTLENQGQVIVPVKVMEHSDYTWVKVINNS